MLQWSIVELSVHLSKEMEPAADTSRILFYPRLAEAGGFTTEIKGHTKTPAKCAGHRYYIRFAAKCEGF
jgi:hypothetical protein